MSISGHVAIKSALGYSATECGYKYCHGVWSGYVLHITRARIQTHILQRTCDYIYIHKYICTYIYIYIHTNVDTNTVTEFGQGKSFISHVCAYRHTHSNVCVTIHMYIHTCAYTYTHTYIQMWIRILSQSLSG